MKDIIQKTKLFGQLKHQNGAVLLWGDPMIISPVICSVMHDKTLKEQTSEEILKKVNYLSGKQQAYMGTKIMSEKFGYKKSLKNQKDLLLFNGKQAELLGHGKITWTRIDFSNNIFMLKMETQYAKVYRQILGASKNTTCQFNAGEWAGCLEYIVDKPMACIETQCISQGKAYCEFVIKEISKWDKKDALVKNNNHVFDKSGFYYKQVKV